MAHRTTWLRSDFWDELLDATELLATDEVTFEVALEADEAALDAEEDTALETGGLVGSEGGVAQATAKTMRAITNTKKTILLKCERTVCILFPP